MSNVIVAIDGPAGAGKSTVGRAVAVRLGLDYLDTGAMYRGVTFGVLLRGLDPSDSDAVADVATVVDLVVADGGITVDGVDAAKEIRGREVTAAVSAVAANSAVRSELVRRQREWVATHGGGVIEGRDIGSVVFPDARLKVYLSARPEVRAARRAGEVSELDFDTVAADLARRDALDSARQHDPLRRADGAVEVDTSDLTIDQVVALLADELMREAATPVPAEDCEQ